MKGVLEASHQPYPPSGNSSSTDESSEVGESSRAFFSSASTALDLLEDTLTARPALLTLAGDITGCGIVGVI